MIYDRVNAALTELGGACDRLVEAIDELQRMIGELDDDDTEPGPDFQAPIPEEDEPF